MCLFWLLIIFLPPAWSLQPRCKLTTLSSQAPGTTRGEVILGNHKFLFLPSLVLISSPSNQVVCTCRSFQPTYTGNLNFVKGALAGAARLDGRLDVVLTNCSHLHLELNFHTLGRRPVDLRIENSGNVRIGHVELAAWEGRGQAWPGHLWALASLLLSLRPSAFGTSVLAMLPEDAETSVRMVNDQIKAVKTKSTLRKRKFKTSTSISVKKTDLPPKVFILKLFSVQD